MAKKTEQEREEAEAKAFADRAVRVSEHYDEYIVIASMGDLFLWKASSHPFAIRGLSSVVNSIAETMIAKDEALTAKYEALADSPEKNDGIED